MRRQLLLSSPARLVALKSMSNAWPRACAEKGSKMVNPESASQLQALLEMLKRKALETSSAGGQQPSNEIFSRPVTRTSHERVNPEVSSRLHRLLELLAKKTIDGSIRWDEQVRDQLFSTSVANSTFAIERGHRNVTDLFAFEIYDSRGALVSRVISADEQYPESVRDRIVILCNTVSARASHLVSLLDQTLDALENRPPSAH